MTEQFSLAEDPIALPQGLGKTERRTLRRSAAVSSLTQATGPISFRLHRPDLL